MFPVELSDVGTLFLRKASSVDSGRDLSVSVGSQTEELFTILFRGRFTGLLYANGHDETLRVVSSHWERRISPVLREWLAKAEAQGTLQGIRVICEDEKSYVSPR